jgi:hypothetical protein
MKGIAAGFLIALGAILFSQHSSAVEYGQTPQQFMAQSQSTGKAGNVRQRAAEPRQTDLYIIAGLRGSWLENNLGASRPVGAPGPWCGFAMRLEVMSMGRPDPGPAYNAVRAWHDYGTPAPRAAVGSLFISRGHISKVVEGECPAGLVRTISGNAIGARVTYMCEPLSSLVVSRWP